MTKLLTCPVCGGHLKINLHTDLAVCDSCGEIRDVDDSERRRIRKTYENAALYRKQNTAAGYREAIRRLETISELADVQDEIASCEAQLSALTEKQTKQRATAKDTEKKDTAIGIFLIVILALIALAAVAGVITLIVLWRRGQLSPTTVTVIGCVIAVIAVLAIIGKAKSGQ